MPRMGSLIERLAEGPLVGDGAMGTYLHELGYDIRRGPESMVLSDPDAIRRVHAAYVEAGAELLETNTFGANALTLSDGGLEGKVREINATAARLALAAADGRAWVAGAIGPVASTPHDEFWDENLARAAYREQAVALCESGVHALLLETFDDIEGALPAMEECRRVADGRVPLIAQMVFAEGQDASGANPDEVARRLVSAGAAVVGANCGRGLQSIRRAVDGLLVGSAGAAFVSAYPNAGYPERIGGRTVYLTTPAYIAAQAAEWAGQGVRLLGGCCGTTPETIRAIHHALAARRRVPSLAPTRRAAAPLPPVETPKPSSDIAPGGFLESIRGVRRPVIVEIDPPPHLLWQPVAAGARALLAEGAHAISLAENPLASIRMDNFFLGAQIRRETGGQAICHVTCRDRNSIGLQSTLMAAHAGGIEAILAVTGDPAGRGGHPRVVSVYELTSLGLVRLVAGLNRGRTSAGRDLRGATRFSIGVAYNSSAANPEAEAARLRRKQAEGAVFAMTQPVFDPDHARRVLEQTRLDGLRVFLGLLPPISLKMALHLHHEAPGIRLPEKILARLGGYERQADQERVAVDLVAELIERLADEADGLYLIAPGARWDCLLPLLARIQALRGSQVVRLAGIEPTTFSSGG